MADRLGSFELLLLLAVQRLAGGADEAYGVPIRLDIERCTGRVASPGAIYTALDRLERRGLVHSRLGDPTPQRGGKRKRHYRLTVKGASEVRRAQADIARMAHGLQPTLETP
jgi:PadR family transcriptional regulator PadR